MSRLNRNQWIAVAVAIFVVGYFLLFDLITGMWKPDTREIQITQMDNDQNTVPTADIAAATSTNSATPTGPAAKEGSTVTVDYTLKLANGQVIDTSVGRGPFSFVIGAHQVISGWETGLVGVRAGEHKTLVITPENGYGALQPGQAKSHPLQGETLYFDIDVISVQ